MSSKLYVGNLPFSSNEDALKELFSQCGTVESVNIITDRDTGRSKGFGFVEMESNDQAESAIEKFNGYEFDGRAIKVSKAQPKENSGGRRKPGGFGGGGGGGGRGGHDRGGQGGRNRW